MRVLATVCLLFGLAGHSQAQNINTGSFYYPGCKLAAENVGQPFIPNTELTFLAGACQGAIYAITSIGNVLPLDRRFCLPQGAHTTQSIFIVFAYMQANPKLLHLHISNI